jgi:hypothetical protein
LKWITVVQQEIEHFKSKIMMMVINAATRLYQQISVITGLIMIVIAVVFEIRKRILQRRGS